LSYVKLPPYPLLKDGEISGTLKEGEKGSFLLELRCTVKQVYITKKVKDILFGIQNTIPIYEYFWEYHILKFVNQYKIECIHLHDLYMANVGWKAKRKTVIKFILDLHENYPEAILNYKWANNTWKKWLAKPFKWAKIEERLLSYPDKIIVVLDYYKQKLLAKYPQLINKITVYPNVPDLKEFALYPIDPNAFDKKDRFLLFYFGVISERRGIMTVLKAVEQLKYKYQQIHLLLIGPIDKSETETFNKALQGQLESITHFPWRDISEIPSFISNIDVCICPILKTEQHETTLANKIFQYAYFGKPMIVSDCKPQIDFINEAACGLVFRSNDIEDLKEKIEYLINNPEKCIEFGNNGKKSVEEKYNAEAFKEKLLEVYKTEIDQ